VPPGGFFSPESTGGSELFDRNAYDVERFHPRIYKTIGVGRTALGDAALFDFSFRGGDPDVTVVGFRVPRALPSFTIHHVLVGDRVARWLARTTGGAPAAGSGTGTVSARVMLGPAGVQLAHPTPSKPPIAFDDRADFVAKWIVRALDATATRRVLTPAAIDALVAFDDGSAVIEKGGDWLFFYRHGRTAQPAAYRAFVDDAVRILGRFELGGPAL
jgi:hypothetical protein